MEFIDGQEKQIRISCIDTGIGIKEKNLVKLFKEFSQLNDSDNYEIP